VERGKPVAYALTAIIFAVATGCDTRQSAKPEVLIADYLRSVHNVRPPQENSWWIVLTGSACSSCNDAVLERAAILLSTRPDVFVIATTRLCQILERRFPGRTSDRVLCDGRGEIERLDLSTKGVLLLRAIDNGFVEHREIREEDLATLEQVLQR